MFRIGRLAALVAIVFLTTAPHSTAMARDVSPDDMARFLAGMPPSPESPLAPLTRNPNWQQHAKWFDSNWEALEKQRLSKVRAWSERHLKNRHYPLYYMFSGPDFLYADAFFPTASTYLLSGLEPVGSVPAITERTIAWLPRIQQSIGSSLRFSFFITKQMRQQLTGGGELSGTLPILLVYIARAGKTIREITLVNLDRDGVLHPGMGEARGMVPGVKIVFVGTDGTTQTLYYFRTDVSNSGVNNSGFLKFAASLGVGNALLKSASYLMHSGNFTQVRDFVLQHSQSIVQDDSGIPFASFRPEVWNFYPFGNYLGPIAIFPNRHQPRLGELFRRSKAPLEFGIGYRHRGHDSNLLLAVRKEALVPVLPAPAAPVSAVPAPPAPPGASAGAAMEERLPPLPPPLPPLEVPSPQR